MLGRLRRMSPTMVMKARNVFFVLLGVAGLVLKGHYSGVHQEAIRSYAGNIAASFSVYYVVAHLPFPSRLRRLSVAGLAFAVVGLFEALDGFGVMTNVYDRADFVANAAGIALALAADCLTSGIGRRLTHAA